MNCRLPLWLVHGSATRHWPTIQGSFIPFLAFWQHLMIILALSFSLSLDNYHSTIIHGFSMTIDSLNDNGPLRGGFICYYWIYYLNLSHRISSIDRHETTTTELLLSPDLANFYLTYTHTLLLTARSRWAIETELGVGWGQPMWPYSDSCLVYIV